MDENIVEQAVSNKLRELRRARGLTVQEFAKELKENYQKVGRIERGKTNLTLDYLVKTSNALDVSIADLLGKEEPKTAVAFDAHLLEKIIAFFEANAHDIRSCSPKKKAALISKIYEMCTGLPKENQEQSLNSLLKISLLLNSD